MKTIKTMYESYKKPESKSKLKLILIAALGVGAVGGAGILGYRSMNDTTQSFTPRASAPIVRDYTPPHTATASPEFLNSFRGPSKVVDNAKSFFGSHDKKISKRSHGKQSKKWAKKHKKHRGHKYAKHKKHKHGKHFAHKKKHHKRHKLAAKFKKPNQVASVK